MNRTKQSIFTSFGKQFLSSGGILPAVLLMCIINGIPGANLNAQTLPVDDIREEQIRLQQLLHGSEYSSFTNRPVWRGIYDTYMDLAEGNTGWWNRKIDTFEKDLGYTFRVGVYEPFFQTTANSRLPYGENNGAAWYGRGLNTEFEAGLWLTSDYLTITLRPHYIFHQNKDFEVPRFIPSDENGNLRYVAEGIHDVIDRPFRFGSESFSTSSWGHSSIRVHYNEFELGLSNEALWWGGNVKYPLMMSNNAPGMRHFFLGTREPFKIPYVGKFEFRYMGGFPKDSGYFDLEEEYQRDRFMNAVNLSFSPAFLPNLHLGITRAVHTYIDEDGLKWDDLSMIFDPFYLENFIEKRGDADEAKPRNHLNSIYMRWVWPAAHTEIYGEFFRQDFSWDSRDFLMEPQHNAGYAFGLQKLFFAPWAEMYRLTLELTNMTPSFLSEVRPQDYYYGDTNIRQGHTNRGQILGAAIGPGSNSQFIGIDAFTENGRFGIFVRRLADNNHFHFEYDRSLNRPWPYGDYWRHRTDLNIGGRFFYATGPFHFSGELSWTKLFNYGRFDYGLFGPGLNITNFTPYDTTNVQFQLSIRYLFW